MVKNKFFRFVWTDKDDKELLKLRKRLVCSLAAAEKEVKENLLKTIKELNKIIGD